MRRLATTLSTSAAALLLVAAPALAAPGHSGSHGTSRHAESHAKAAPHREAPHKKSPHKPAPHKPVKRVIELTGVLSDTATATISVPSDTSTVTISDTATATITIRVKGGERSLHGKSVVLVVDGKTVVRRGDRRATIADLRRGDHLSVKAVRGADGRWYALRVNASRGH